MFGVFRVAKARKTCVQALLTYVVRPKVFGPWPPHFWQDPFVIGFVAYVISNISHMATNGKLNTEQRGLVLIGTLKDVGASPTDFLDRMEILAPARDPAFMLGARNAETIITYVFNLHPMPGDSDVAAAKELARGTTLTGNVDRAEIGGALINMLYTNIVKQRLGDID
ncbi:MAG: hypothetical protein CTY39_06280 [Hyphomicrobium sp.]|nr:MAG: hypothetical protein CTY39_06280 [Hyphomicrobium sp.]